MAEVSVIELHIPGLGQLRLAHAVFDVNGTLAADGVPEPRVGQLLGELAAHMQVHLLSALTHGNRAGLEAGLGLPIYRVVPGDEAQQKADYVRRLGAEGCAAIGNGRNDVRMLEAAVLAIAVLGPEGAAAQALAAADVVVRSPAEAIGLLLHPRRMVATLRS